MNGIKARTETGVRFEGPLRTRADYERAIRFLEQELSILEKTKPKKTVQKSRGGDESCET